MKRRIKLRLIVAGLLIVTALSFSACGHSKSVPTDVLKSQVNDFIAEGFEEGLFDELHDKWFALGTEGKDIAYDELTGENGTILFGTKTVEPFVFKLNGEYVGYTIDLVFRFCKQYGYNLEIKDFNNSNAIVMGTSTGKIDFGGSTISITDERKKSVDYSDPYYYNSCGVVIRKSDHDRYSTLDDLEGTRCGTETGTIYPDLIKKNVKNAEVLEYNTFPDSLTALENNKIDSAFEDAAVLEYIILGRPDLETAMNIDTGDRFGFIFPKEGVETGFVAGLKSSLNKTFVVGGRWKEFVKGIVTTLLITILSIIIGTILGFVVHVMCRKGNKLPNYIRKLFAWIAHGTPEVVLLMIFYYVIFGKLDFGGTMVSVVVFSLLFGVSVEGMLTNSVSAIDRGQFEASYALGYSDRSTFYKMILPQSMRLLLPNYKIAVVSQIKSTAIVGYIAVQDLTKTSDIIRSSTYEAFFPLIVTALLYFILVWLLTIIVNRIEINTAVSREKTQKFLKGVDLHD